jgi:Protein of unknown function (DUF2934)
MRNHTGKRSRPRADIEPIRVSELLTGAGMTGFLSVLEPPAAVPHLKEFALQAAGFWSPQLAQWLSVRSEALLRQLGGQQEALAAIAEVARRTNGGAERLRRLAEGIRSKTIHHAALSTACHLKRGELFMKKIAVARVRRASAAEAGWQEWISDTTAARPAQEVTLTPQPPAANGDLLALHEAIARLAYAHWQERGCPSGSAEEDWLHAERQLLQVAKGV